MAKITAKYDYKKDGTKNTRAYQVSLSKLGVEETGLQNSEIKIIYEKDRIIIEKAEN